jgi:hypothetical protein
MTDKKYPIYYFRDGPNGKRQLHREDGPAAEWATGRKAWYVNGKLHRLDGPAVIWASGSTQWYINGEELTEEKFKIKTDKLYQLLYT